MHYHTVLGPGVWIKVWAGSVQAEGSRGQAFLAPCSFWWLLALLGLRRPHADPCLCLCMAFLPVGVSSVPRVQVSLLSLVKTKVFGFRAHLNPLWSYLNFITPNKTYFHIRTYSQIPGIRNWNYLGKERQDIIQPTMNVFLKNISYIFVLFPIWSWCSL